jgi:hypothetical protein
MAKREPLIGLPVERSRYKTQSAHGRYKVQNPITTARIVKLEPRGGLLQVLEAWRQHLPCKPSTCSPFLEDNLARDNGEQSICRRRWPNSLAI